jgi:Cu/Zn superoxide dismutase
MKSLLLPAAILAFAATSAGAVLAADSMMGSDSTAGSKVYTLTAQNGSGETGTVALVPQGEKTMVVVLLAGAPSGIPQPAHIHVGPCAKLDPTPKYPLTSAKDGVSMTTIDQPLAKLVNSGFAVNIHKSADDIKTYVACGNLGS